MPYEVKWHIEKYIIHARYSGVLTIEELAASSSAISRMTEAGEAPVHVITDLGAIEAHPNRIVAIRQAITNFKNPQRGWIIYLGSTPIQRFILVTMGRFLGVHIRSAESLEEAEKILHRVDSRLSSLSGKR